MALKVSLPQVLVMAMVIFPGILYSDANKELEYCFHCNGQECRHYKDNCATEQTRCYIIQMKQVNSSVTYQAGCTDIQCTTLQGRNQLCLQNNGNNSTKTTCNVLSCCQDDLCNDIEDVIGSDGDTLKIRINVVVLSMMNFLLFQLTN